MLTVEKAGQNLGVYSIPSDGELIAIIDTEIGFRFRAPHYPPPPPIPDDKNIDKMDIDEILEYLKTRISGETGWS